MAAPTPPPPPSPPPSPPPVPPGDLPLRNGDLAELLARAAEGEEGHRARALRRAAWHALTWPEEAAAVAARGAPLTVFTAVGPWVAARIEGWLDRPPEVPEPPPSRTGFLTFAEARAVVASAPGWRAGMGADLQLHTTSSDGTASLAEMAAAAASLGHGYVAVTDHSRGLRIARGMDEEGFARQAREVRELNDVLEGDGFRVLHGIEANLGPDGSIDMDPGFLGGLDLVLAAFHSRLRERDDQTGRYLAALERPAFDVLAHPRTRKFNDRPGLPADWGRVLEAAAARGVAVEIDAYPDRQDLDVQTLALAREAGCWVSLGTDAHHPRELAFFELGMAAAIRAWIPRERVLNFLPPDEVVAWARGRRAR